MTRWRHRPGLVFACAVLVLPACQPADSSASPTGGQAPAASVSPAPAPGAASGAGLQGFPGYDLGQADLVFPLPLDLAEISAITHVDGDAVACLEDERGLLYFVDLQGRQVTERVPFGADGDYEGLARVDDTFFVLRSDGELTQLRRSGARFERLDGFELDLRHADFEGLCHDGKHGRLLIAPKDPSSSPHADKDDRPLYAFDLETRRTLPEPFLMLSRKAINDRAEALGAGRQAGKDSLKLRFSDLAVHPITDDIYILSAVDRALLAVDRQGQILALHVFAGDELAKAEGITFEPDGDMIVSSEGVDVAPVVRVYRYQPPSG